MFSPGLTSGIGAMRCGSVVLLHAENFTTAPGAGLDMEFLVDGVQVNRTVLRCTELVAISL
jgi:hypothetical protein